jgi:hypothetical protein
VSGDGTTALVIASVSLGVSLATFVWRIVYDIFWDAPRLRVVLDARTIYGYGQQPVDVYVVEATNVGRRPTTLTSLWLVFGRPARRWQRFTRRLLSKNAREKRYARGIMITPMCAEVQQNTPGSKIRPACLGDEPSPLELVAYRAPAERDRAVNRSSTGPRSKALTRADGEEHVYPSGFAVGPVPVTPPW